MAGQEEEMSLALNAREVGEVVVVKCSGRIVAGGDSEALRAHITERMQDRKAFVLHLGEVAFIDSTGLGIIVRLLTTARRSRGDLKLCSLPRTIENLLNMTSLNQLFEIHDSEESAISAFYRATVASQDVRPSGASVLCIDTSSDVLAYLRVLLKRRGYDVQTTVNVPDALILLKARRPALLVVGPNLTASPATRQAFETACTRIPVVEMGSEFATLHAGEAASRLLDCIQARLQPNGRPTQLT
jgi:anti-sigma B factor antagonist